MSPSATSPCAGVGRREYNMSAPTCVAATTGRWEVAPKNARGEAGCARGRGAVIERPSATCRAFARSGGFKTFSAGAFGASVTQRDLLHLRHRRGHGLLAPHATSPPKISDIINASDLELLSPKSGRGAPALSVSSSKPHPRQPPEFRDLVAILTHPSPAPRDVVPASGLTCDGRRCSDPVHSFLTNDIRHVYSARHCTVR